MMYVKFHEQFGRTVVAICDEDILGKTFTEGDLELKVCKKFYGGEKVEEEEAKRIMEQSTNLNLVGKKIINLALKIGVIKKENVIKIGGIPYAQSFVL